MTLEDALPYEVVGRTKLNPAALDASISRRCRAKRRYARESIEQLKLAYATGVVLPPIVVRAERDARGNSWPTNLVVDGGLRTIAAQELRLPEIEAELVVLTLPDTPPEALFLHFNWHHGLRLSFKDRKGLLRAMVRRYQNDEYRARFTAEHVGRLASALGFSPAYVWRLLKGRPNIRTVDERAEAVRLYQAGVSAMEIARFQGVSRQAIEKGIQEDLATLASHPR